MFTGIVETIGTVSELKEYDNSEPGGKATSLTITDCAEILVDAHLGDSINVNGTCLTVTSFTPTQFTVGIAPETLRRTNLGTLRQHSKVNLERALLPHTRMGGHFVQGHVDTVATITSVTPDGNAKTYRLAPRDPAILKWVVEKGYISLDGTSLTVTAVSEPDAEEGWWEVMLVVYTQGKVVMGNKGVGEQVNVEVDQVGKYVERGLRSMMVEGGGGWLEKVVEGVVERAVEERLKKAEKP